MQPPLTSFPSPTSSPTPPPPHSSLSEGFKLITRILYTQIGLSVVCGLIFWVWKGWIWGLSALIGGGVAVLPQILFAAIYFRQTSTRAYARASAKVVNRFFMAEAVKWLSTIGLFTVAFQWSKLKALPLFITFIATQLAFWLVPLIVSLVYEHSIRIHSSSSRTSHSKDKLGDV